MRRAPLLLSLCLLFVMTGARAEKVYREVVIDDPFIELHTGPGRGYPIFYIAERGEQVELLMQRTDWFKVRIERGEEGWVHRQQLKTTLNLDGEPFDLPGLNIEDSVGAGSGVYGDFGANAISTYGAFNLTVSRRALVDSSARRFSTARSRT
jgi:uncharacterized protein YgiM (DUF1202 family)